MLVIAICTLVLLIMINIYIYKSYSYPPVVFTMVWVINLSGLLLAGNLFYPISVETLLVYIVGAMSFSIGGIVQVLLVRGEINYYTPITDTHKELVKRIINICLVILIIAIPIYWGKMQELALSSSINNYWGAIRQLSIQRHDETITSISIIDNLVPFSIIIAWLSCNELDGSNFSKVRAVVAFVLASFYTIFTGARSGILILLIVPVSMIAIRNRRFPWKLAIVMFFLVILSFSFIAIQRELAFKTSELSLVEGVAIALEHLGLYAFGGSVAFDSIVNNTNSIPSIRGILWVFIIIANKFGAGIDMPLSNAEFTMVSSSFTTNVYTVYFGYFSDYGWFGVILGMLFQGFVITWIYRIAMRKNSQAVVVYSVFFYAMLKSGFNDEFFEGLNLLIKLMVAIFMLYRFPRMFPKYSNENYIVTNR